MIREETLFGIQLEQKFADRFRDLFNSSWAGALNFLVATLISVWFWGAEWAALFNRRHYMPRPLTWWRFELAQIGIHYPHWLNAITNWHTPHGGGIVFNVLIIVALSATAGMRQKDAPGFGIVAWLALALSTQWFGLVGTIFRYGELVCIIALVAGVMGVISVTRKRFGSNLIEHDRVHFSKAFVICGLTNLLLDAFFPVVFPIIPLGVVIRTMGYDPSRHSTSPAVKLLESELRDLERSATQLNDLPAATAFRLGTAIQLIAASPAMHREAVDMLSYRGPTGARFIQPVSDLPRPGMVPPLIDLERADNMDGLRLYTGEPTANS